MQLEKVPNMSDDDVSMSGRAAAVDAPNNTRSNVRDNAESVIGAHSISSPMLINRQ